MLFLNYGILLFHHLFYLHMRWLLRILFLELEVLCKLTQLVYFYSRSELKVSGRGVGSSRLNVHHHHHHPSQRSSRLSHNVPDGFSHWPACNSVYTLCEKHCVLQVQQVSRDAPDLKISAFQFSLLKKWLMKDSWALSGFIYLSIRCGSMLILHTGMLESITAVTSECRWGTSQRHGERKRPMQQPGWCSVTW